MNAWAEYLVGEQHARLKRQRSMLELDETADNDGRTKREVLKWARGDSEDANELGSSSDIDAQSWARFDGLEGEKI